MQQEASAFFDAYDVVEFELATGELITGKPLGLAQAAHWMRTMVAVKEGDADAIMHCIEDFPKAIDAEDQLAHLQPIEVFDVVERFLVARRTRRTPQATTTQAEARAS